MEEKLGNMANVAPTHSFMLSSLRSIRWRYYWLLKNLNATIQFRKLKDNIFIVVRTIVDFIVLIFQIPSVGLLLNTLTHVLICLGLSNIRRAELDCLFFPLFCVYLSRCPWRLIA
jgi:hypothetical protein